MAGQNVYRVDLREMSFVLWEQFKVHETILGRAPFQDFDRKTAWKLIEEARDFAYRELGPLYQSADREGCTLQSDGKVELPQGFAELWQRFVDQGWTQISAPADCGGMEVPYVVLQAIFEMFMGANPSFISYAGFAVSLTYLIRKFGNEKLQQLFCGKLASNHWSASMCMTEPDAGSDVGNIRTRAIRQADGTYLIEGGKVFISAGYHDLTDNTIYAVLARVEGAPPSTHGLSCFIVPRYWVNEAGDIDGDNHVRCIRLEEKMGLNGCATAQLAFGENGPCRAYLLGERENIGLKQILDMMNEARIYTGIFALGMASSAYLNAAEYAGQRLQGTDLKQAFNPRAAKVPIIQHHDVRRMLLEMKSKVEGCRALIYKLTHHVSLALISHHQGEQANEQEIARHKGLVNLLTPIVKAYTSDQAWRIAELAIQVYGGYGYTRDYPIEQYARDVKILSIWEGTNYIQAADLIRDKLAMGRESKLLKLYVDEVQKFINDYQQHPEFQSELEKLQTALETLVSCHARFGQWIRTGKIELVFVYATRFLEMMAEVTLAWLLLEAGQIAATSLDKLDANDADIAFYKGKIISARYFVRNHLPRVISTAQIMAEEDKSVLEADQGVFLERSQLYV